MKRIVVSLLFAAAGCAGGMHAREPYGSHHYVLDGVELQQSHVGEVSASREWQREDTPAARDNRTALRSDFVTDLGRRVQLVNHGPQHLRVMLTLKDNGYSEGLAPETVDVVAQADVLDDKGAVVRTVTLHEPASAPLQRSASARDRLSAAFDRLAKKLAADL